MRLTSPFDDRELDEPHLSEAPLVRVLAQVRHPALAVLVGEAGEETAARLANKLAPDYPFVEQRAESELIFTSLQITEKPSTTLIWRLRTRDEQWQLSFGRQFVALDTSAYHNRDDFCDRLKQALAIYAEVVNPQTALRVGIRYINRIDEPGQVANLPQLVRPEVLGPASVPLPLGVELQHALTQVLHNMGEDGIQAQWGMLPPNAVLDASMSPVNRASWVLDLDAFSVGRSMFDVVEITSLIAEMACRAYRYFRWVVTEEFIVEFGGRE